MTMTPRVFAVVFTLLWFVTLLLSTMPDNLLEASLIAISTGASYVFALNVAYRAITLGLVRG